MNTVSHPVLSCDEARDFEARLFGGDEAKEWPAMQRAGRAIAAAVLRDFQEIGGFPADGRVLVLAGKGHNGGDALIAAQAILERFPAASATVVFAFGERTLRPLAARAWRELVHAAPGRVAGGSGLPPTVGYALCLDGVFGFQFRPPVPPALAALFAQVAARPIRLRAAVDLPSGLGEMSAQGDPILRADFTYATGSVKTPLVNGANGDCVGRLRYLDLGFFDDASDANAALEEDVSPTDRGVGRGVPAEPSAVALAKVEPRLTRRVRPTQSQKAKERGFFVARLRVLTPAVLAPLAKLRAPESDKRTYGHLFVLGGSRSYPGAVLMAVEAALRGGAGLVTAFVPESLAAAFAAQVPEAMWVGWPETPAGGLALEGRHLLIERIERATALVVGPGLAREAETMALVADIVRTSPVPLVLDADTLQPEIVRAGTAPRVLTPHLGELQRILAGDDFYATTAGSEAIMVVKGRLTCVTGGGGRTGYYSPFGGPVLARGGSGDLLAGMIGARLAQIPADPLRAAAQGVVWHGLAADALARARGQVAVRTTQVLDFLPVALRECGA